MRLPDNTEFFETAISTHWFDESGIICSVSKKVERTIDHYKEIMNLYAKLIKNDNKLCLLSDPTNAMPMDKVVREYIITEMPKYIKAHAIISAAPLGATLNTTFLKASFSGFQIKLFSNEEEAKEWLKEYL